MSRAQEIASRPQEWRGLMGEIKLAHGVLAAAEKRWEDANEAFQEAVDIHRRYHLPYYEARALCEWAGMHVSRDSAGDRKRVKELLDRSLNIFQKIRAEKLVQKVQARKHRLGT